MVGADALTADVAGRTNRQARSVRRMVCKGVRNDPVFSGYTDLETIYEGRSTRVLRGRRLRDGQPVAARQFGMPWLRWRGSIRRSEAWAQTREDRSPASPNEVQTQLASLGASPMMV